MTNIEETFKKIDKNLDNIVDSLNYIMNGIDDGALETKRGPTTYKIVMILMWFWIIIPTFSFVVYMTFFSGG